MEAGEGGLDLNRPEVPLVGCTSNRIFLWLPRLRLPRVPDGWGDRDPDSRQAGIGRKVGVRSKP